MPAARVPVPDALGEGPFSLRQARAAGIHERLRRSWLHTPHRGVRTRQECVDVTTKAAALLPVLPDGACFSHQTAAHLLGLPLPWHMSGEGSPLHVTTAPGSPAVRRLGVVAHRATPLDRAEPQGLPVTGPVTTWLDLCPRLTHDELVVIGDAMCTLQPGLVRGLADGLSARAGTRGVVNARTALASVRVGSRSPMETLVRLRVIEAGLPEPELNAVVHDRHGGWLAEVDLLWRDERVILEYDGRWHDDPRQRRLDQVRRRELRHEGWVVIEMTAEDMRHLERVVRLVNTALSR